MQALTTDEIHALLLEALPDAQIDIRDDTHKHLGHNAQVDHHGQHLLVKVVWAGFKGMARMKRHRTVWKLFDKAWKAQRIHSLSLRLMTPEEAR